MKRYKLKKDTPAFKAGTECYIEEAGHMVPCRGISYTIVHKDQLEKNPNILTDWFEEIKEPLIKYDKVRKAVRAWADVNSIERVFIQNNYCLSSKDDDSIEIVFARPVFKDYVNDGDFYDIDELCGVEEE